MPFGTRNADLETDNFYCFVNDRLPHLRGYRSGTETNKFIYWEYHPLLMVTKTVESDWPEDQTREFTFTVQLSLGGVSFPSAHNYYGDMDFNRNGTASVKVKAGESKTAVLPASLHLHDYTVTEVLTEVQQEDYTTTATKDNEAFEFVTPLTVTGKLGENIGEETSTNSNSLSDVIYINTRKTGDLTISKKVDNSVEDEKAESFSFRLTLDPKKTNAKDKINKTYTTVRKDSAGNETDGTLTFTQSVAEFTLKDGESVTVKNLPTDLPYKVEELLTDRQKLHVRPFVRKNEGEDSYSKDATVTGVIGDYTKIEEGTGKEICASDILFTNSFLEIVCKITNRSRALLYYRDASKNLQPAVFSHLEEAFDILNSGSLRTATGGTAPTYLRIEMVVPEYTMERTATLESGRTVILSTALPTDKEFPYNNGVDDGNGNISTVTRSFAEGSMIVEKGPLTLDKITLDGASEAEEPIQAVTDGGIVQVAGNVKLTVNISATLRNSAVTGSEEPEGAKGSGGAIYLSAAGASLAMNGTIENCAAENGGGIYAADGFTTLNFAGPITGCKAVSGDGGAICAGNGTSVNLNEGTVLTGNSAKNDGGAVYSDTKLNLRGSVGRAEANQGNTAGNEGGGIYMGSNAIFTMYAGSEISGNKALNGGGLSTCYSTRIAGGTLSGNEAEAVDSKGGLGGAIYAKEGAVVEVSGTAVLAYNRAVIGGAAYDQGSLTMKGGSMKGNIATQKGGAVYVADTAAEGEDAVGHSFSMTGGSINAGNKSPEGAISTDAHAVLNFSGNCVVSDNTALDGETPMNVCLGYDSNDIIRTTGLGASARVGVYVVDGEPEDESVPDRVDNPIYSDHGVSGRNFGTYTGSNVGGARLNKFTNDRNTVLTGMTGDQIEAGYHVAWQGLGLNLKVTQYLPQLDNNGDVVLDEEGNPILSENLVPVRNASFTLTNITNATEVQVWSGKSNADGLVSIPWGGNETENGNAASFKPNTTYRLDQTNADSKTVLPAGHWTVAIARDNTVTWTVTPSKEENVDRIFNIVTIKESVLGETFGLNNDVKPTMTFDATGGVLKDREAVRTDTIPFTTSEVKHEYTITETDPTWGSHVFKQWATMPAKPEVEVETEDMTEEEIEQAKEAMRRALGYYEYTRGNEITFFRGTDTDIPAEKYTGTESRGNMTLYAQWEPVVCKITTSLGGNVVYEVESGYPAAYGTLEEGFRALNSKTLCTVNDPDPEVRQRSAIRSTAILYLEMLVSDYTMTESVMNTKLGSVVLTTAPWSSTDTDGYPYSGNRGTVCTIYRGDCDSTMIVNTRNLTLRDITLDGRIPRKDMYGTMTEYETVRTVCDGGFVDNRQSSRLTIGSNATLQYSDVDGNGGAIHLTAGTSLTMSGGAIRNCSATGSGGAVYAAPNAAATITGGTITGNTAASGAGFYLSESSTMNLSGNPYFGGTGLVGDALVTTYQNGEAAGNFITQGYTAEENEKNGGKNYTDIRQDIYIAGYVDTDPAASLNVTGRISSGEGTIWVWADSVNHYEMLKQFAVFSGGGISLSDPNKESSMKAFRNAQPDSLTNCGGDYLTGQKGDDINGYKCIYWTGGFDVVFLKTDGFGKALPGATFTLYSNEACTETFEMTFTGTTNDGKRATTVSSDGTATYKDKNGNVVTLEKGEVLLSKVPPKTFYLKETTPVTGYDRDENKTTIYQIEISSTGGLTMRRKRTGETTYTEAFKEIRQRTAGNLEQYVVMNTPEAERKVILRKVSGSYASLQGAEFQIFRYDGTPVSSIDINGAATTTFESGVNGVYFIDKLSYGTYYLYEKKAPSGYTDGKWFTLTVSGDNTNGSRDGVTVAEITDEVLIAQLNQKFVKP